MVRSTSTGEKMASVIIHPQQMAEEGIQKIMEQLHKHFFNGEGAECELDSLYLQAWWVKAVSVSKVCVRMSKVCVSV